MRAKVIAPLAMAWAIVSCGQATSNEARSHGTAPDPPDGSAPPVTEAECALVDPSLGERDAAELFDATTVPTFDVLLPPERWAELRRNARDEETVEATACFEGRGLGRVGFRFKGAEGSLFSCFDESGNQTCKKLPLKLVFDELEEEKRFFGLKRLNFHSARYDETYLHERLAYDLFRSMDVIAPRASWAVLRVNGQVEGLFGMVEQVDGRFTADRWPERGDENLFKEVWPVNADATDVLEHLETNEETGDVSAFMSFAAAMDAAAEEELRTTLGQYTDLDHWARYMAVDDAIAAYDGITTFYTSPDGSWTSNHNLYFYQESPTLFTLVPWDEEATFVVDGFGQVPHWTTTPSDCTLTYPVWGGGGLTRAPGCDRVFRGLAQDLEGYRREGRRLLDGPFTEEAMREAITRHADMIREQVARDPNGPGLARWEQAVGFLESEIPRLRLRLERLLAGGAGGSRAHLAPRPR